jgi:glycerophosphoryl diester phosphodiesterase
MVGRARRPSANRFLAAIERRGDRPLVIAHRGDSAYAPENTLEAALSAFEALAIAWEFDVQLTRDGIPVVLHDESLMRTTDVAIRFAGDPRRLQGFRVSDFDLDEVRGLDAGSWFVDGNAYRSARDFGTLDRLDAAVVARCRSGSVRIPTLEEALVFTRERDWLANVELKSFPDFPSGLVERALDIIAATGTADRVLISSFEHADVVAADRAGRGYALGILLFTPIHRVGEYATETIAADTVHVSAEILGSESVAYRRARSLRPDLISDLRHRGVPVLVYTVNDWTAGGLADQLAALGVAGVFTDDPMGPAAA